MPHKKIDGVIEAVRYAPDGKIDRVCAYQRHGAVWTDRILLDRKELVECLKNGQRLVTGRRKLYLGGTFETGEAVRLEDGLIVTDGRASKRDLLERVPVF